MTAVKTDWQLNGGRSKCMDIVDGVLKDPVKHLNFFPTAFWVDEVRATVVS